MIGARGLCCQARRAGRSRGVQNLMRTLRAPEPAAFNRHYGPKIGAASQAGLTDGAGYLDDLAVYTQQSSLASEPRLPVRFVWRFGSPAGIHA